jgi:cytochrome c553
MIRLTATLCTLALATCLANAQAPANPQAPRGPRPAPKNLKALPKDTTGDQIVNYMHQYTGDLGVGCNFCHAAADPATKRTDYASDANTTKETARFMITMTADLNKQVDAMPSKMYADPITCGTCHRGEKHPSVFVPTPRPAPGAPPAGITAPPSPPPPHA